MKNSKKSKKGLQSTPLDLQIEQQKQMNILLDCGIPALEKYYSAKLEQLEAPRFKWSSAIVAIILAGIILAASFLVYNDKLSSESYVFLVGVIVGYLLTFLKELVFN